MDLINLQLLHMPLHEAAQRRDDALIVLVDERFAAAEPSQQPKSVAKAPAKAPKAAAQAKTPDRSLAQKSTGCAPDGLSVDLSRTIAAAIALGDFKTQAGSTLHLYQSPAAVARKVLLVGAGTGSAADVRTAIAAARAVLRGVGIRSASVCWAATVEDASAAVAAAVPALHEALYTYSLTKAESEKSPRPTLQTLSLVIDAPASTHNALAAAFAQAQASACGQMLAREWGNRPPNHATPTHLGEAAQEIATRHDRITCTVHGPKEVAKLKMGAFEAVAQGSRQPLRFIELHYRGATDADAAPIVLVGKGITFDSGGISIKPAAAMDEMKFDMCGAASVLGVFEALGRVQPAINVTGLIAACENLPDGQALKPGDVITSMSGQTIEVLNTDAEGRLILCDALTFAKRFKPQAIVDIATLTGACVIALGGVRSGLFASDDALAAQLSQAGDATGDLCWRMPLDADYAQGLQSNFADVANVAGRQAGSVTAAKFLQRFVDKDTPWAHLDIAGTAWREGAAKGATGRPVPLLLAYLLSQAQQAQPSAAKSVAKSKAKSAVMDAAKSPAKKSSKKGA